MLIYNLHDKKLKFNRENTSKKNTKKLDNFLKISYILIYI